MSVIIDGYPVDLAITETLTYESEVTEFPVERGADVSDHIRAKRPTLELDGVVSDTPIGKIAADPSRNTLTGSTLPSRDAFDQLVRLHGDRRAVTVECSFGKFDDMVLMSLTPTRDVTTSKAFKFTATFKQIEFRQNNRTSIRVAVPTGSGRANLGALIGKLKDLGVTFVRSTPSDPDLRAGKIRQGEKLVSTTTHAQRLASSLKAGGLNSSGLTADEQGNLAKSPGFDIWSTSDFGPDGKMDHFFADEHETSDGYVTGHNKQDYFYYMSHISSTSVAGKPVTWDYKTGSWVDQDSNTIVQKPPKGADRWKNITSVRAPGPKP